MNKSQGRMFKSVDFTWNPVTGCTHQCGCSVENPEGYCFGRMLHRRYKRAAPFEQTSINERTLSEKMPSAGSTIFVCSTGDLFCSGVPDEWIDRVLTRIAASDAKYNRFLLQTKNPDRFYRFIDKLNDLRRKSRVILGTTLETNRIIPGNAPKTRARFKALTNFRGFGFPVFLSLEPLAEFDFDVMEGWVKELNPLCVEMGLENYSKTLPKPPLDKVQRLYDSITSAGIPVLLKDNLAGLIKEAKR